jgi:hypothetical protein
MTMGRSYFASEFWKSLFKLWKIKGASKVTIGWGTWRICKLALQDERCKHGNNKVGHMENLLEEKELGLECIFWIILLLH